MATIKAIDGQSVIIRPLHLDGWILIRCDDGTGSSDSVWAGHRRSLLRGKRIGGEQLGCGSDIDWCGASKRGLRFGFEPSYG